MASNRSINEGASVRALRILSDPATVLLLIALAVAVLALVPEARPVSGSEAVGAAVVPAPGGDGGAPLLADFAGAVPPLALPTTVECAALVGPAKKIAKLQKKIGKLEDKIATKEAKVDELDGEIVSWQDALAVAQQALLDAQALPETTPAEVKAKKKALKQANKAIKKAGKQIARREKRVDKLQAKIVKHGDKIADLNDRIADLGGLPDAGQEGLEGLRVPRSMHVLAATDDEEEPAEGGSGALAAQAPGDFPPGSDYETDEARAFVYDPSMDALHMVNSILCLMQQTAYDQMVNVGPYNAQIDNALCDAGENGGTGGNGQSTGTTSDLEMWVVDSVRPTEQSRHVVGVWVPSEEHGPEGEVVADLVIHVRVDVEEGISDDNPFGVFAMDFAGVPVDEDDPAQSFFWGTLETEPALEGSMGFTFYNETGDPQGDFYELTEAHVNMLTDGTQGVARVRETFREDLGDGPPVEDIREYVLAFDQENLLRSKDGQQETCLSRVDFQTKVWRYGLYHAAGEQAGTRVERNGGFGFETADGHHGWAGYWGLWWPGDAELQSGDQVTKHAYGEGEVPETFTVLEAPGKLVRNTRQELSLGAIDGEVFEWWELTDDGQGGPPVEHRYAVQYTHVDGLFRKIAEWLPGENGDVLQDLPVPEVLDTAALGWLGLWSNGLGGHVSHVHGDDHVTFFQEEVVNASDPAFGGGTTLALSGYLELLDTGITAQEALAGDVFMPDVLDVGAPVSFVFDAGDLTLYHDVAGDGSVLLPVGLAEGETYEGGPFDWGLRTGPLVTDTGGLADVFDLWGSEVFYVWETGPNPWNRFSTLLDAEGAAVGFDPPLTFTYTHATADDRNGDATFDGKTFQLEYHGPGELHGIPHTGVDIDGDGWEDRWYPDFSLADGVLMGPAGDEYVVRALEMEQTLSEAPGACGALDLATVGDLPLPDGSTYQVPSIGAMPLIDAPPAVLAGEVVAAGEEEEP